MKLVLDETHSEARTFFLKQESYCNFDLPKYFVFNKLLEKISKKLNGSQLSDFIDKPNKPAYFEGVNYKFLDNKDGKFAWRPFQLIHPALYVSLVHCITEKDSWDEIKKRFEEFGNIESIKCYSIPLQSEDMQSDKATSVNQWWQLIEQQSIELALKYEYVLHSDITDCYGSIYTHSVSWALHTKELAKSNLKNNKNSKLLGDIIDFHLQGMSYGQTNGIPQGSVLMNFIGEMVLGYVDLQLSKKIETNQIKDYNIIRYRDDYRIFSNNPQTIKHIAKLLTETLMELGMKLNTQKTRVYDNVVRSSIKADKLYWMSVKNSEKDIQKYLLLIHNLSEEHPNSGSLNTALVMFSHRIEKITKTKKNIRVLVSIVVDIMYKNPRIYPIGCTILSKLLSLLGDDLAIKEILNLIEKKFEKIPNTGHLMIWLQRLTIKIDRNKSYEERLCKKVNDPTIQLWNSNWLNNSLKNLIETTSIIDEVVIEALPTVINNNEVELFTVINNDEVELFTDNY